MASTSASVHRSIGVSGRSLVLITLYSMLVFQVAHGAQRFEEQPQYSEVNPGQEARLTCKIYSKKGQCSWQKDNKPVGIYLGKYEWAGNPDVGDCSIRVLNAILDYDDGEWECQVTASDFAAQDALTSKPVKLVVRVPPNAPQIEFNGTLIPVGKNLTTQGGQKAFVKCISHNGNPPPTLKWFVGDEEVKGMHQRNLTEDDNPKKWSATSTLEYTFEKVHNGKPLRCVALHEAYPTKSRETQAVLDIQYAPEIKLLGMPEGDLEENKNTVTLRCLADANPPAQIIWKKSGGAQVYGYQDAIEFQPLLRKHSGTYSCEAKNYLGTSQSTGVEIDVKFAPRVTRVGPERLVIASLYNRTVLQCQAEGNPQPTYQWLQQTTATDEGSYVRGADNMLVIHNVTYDFQGKYFCKATNMISGTERSTQSDPIDLNVMGAPQVLRHSVDRELEVEKGSEAKLTVVFCSNPGPSKAIWEWGSLQLEAGYEMGRFSAEKVEKSTRDDCYEARLRIARADSSDTRHYYLKIENSHGSDKYSVSLQVRDPVSMSMVIGVIIGCLVLLVICVLIILYAFKSEKWCFSLRGDFKPTDLESEKSDMSGSTRGIVGDTHLNLPKSGFPTISQSDLNFGHHHQQQQRSKTPRPLEVNIPPDYHIMKQQRNERNERGFRPRAYPAIIDSTKEINYSDLQLPRSSNNGSMKKSNKTHHLQQQAHLQQQMQQQAHFQQQFQYHQQHQQQHHHSPIILPPPQPHQRRADFAEIQFKPKYHEHAEV